MVTFWADSHIITPKLLGDLRLNSYVALFSCDDEIYSTSMSINYYSSIDLVVTNDYFGRGIFDQIGVPTIYFSRLDYDLPTLLNHKKFDISFIGNINTADRQNYIHLLEKSIGNDICVVKMVFSLKKSIFPSFVLPELI